VVTMRFSSGLNAAEYMISLGPSVPACGNFDPAPPLFPGGPGVIFAERVVTMSQAEARTRTVKLWKVWEAERYSLRPRSEQ
jgi:hypothetical protein